MSVNILGNAEQPVDRTWRLVATSRAAGVLASDSVGLTVAIYDLAQAMWWNETLTIWQAGREENVMTEAAVLGVYSAALTASLMAPTEADVVVLVTSTDSAEAEALFALRHSMRSLPVQDLVLSAHPTTAAQVLALQACALGGNMVVDDEAKQLVMYQQDGATVLAAFDLKDAAGNPTGAEPFQRLVP